MSIETAPPRSSTPARRSLTRRSRGFTLLEMLITVATLAIVAAIALPSYVDYITRSKIVEATSGLSEMRVRLEQFFADNRRYPTACIASAAGPAPRQPLYARELTTGNSVLLSGSRRRRFSSR